MYSQTQDTDNCKYRHTYTPTDTDCLADTDRMHRPTDRQTYTASDTSRQTDRQAGRYADRPKDKRMSGMWQRDEQTDRQAGKQTDQQTQDKWPMTESSTDRLSETSRQTNQDRPQQETDQQDRSTWTCWWGPDTPHRSHRADWHTHQCWSRSSLLCSLKHSGGKKSSPNNINNTQQCLIHHMNKSQIRQV